MKMVISKEISYLIIVDSSLLEILKESVLYHIHITDPSLGEQNELGNMRSFPVLLFHDSIRRKTIEQKKCHHVS